MDGGELLARVRDLQPQAARIVMSGSVELNVVARAANVAHRVLAKPCKADDLMRIVARACELGELTAAESLRRAATSATGLPAAPAGYQRLLRALEDPDASAHSVARVLEQDVGMAAKVLQLANSAYFGARQPVSKLEQAVANVGPGSLASLALSAGAFEAFRPAGRVGGLSIDALQRHSTLVATIARDLMPAGHQRDEAFAAGHAEVGAYLLDLWGVPPPVVEAVAYHHRLPPEPPAVLDATCAVALAEALAHRRQPEPELPRESEPLPPPWREIAG